jgi:polyhydroxyalkanoate synthesis repressor PhaR
MAYVIKRYSNRKLYDTQESRYVTLEEIEEMIRGGREISVVDASSGEDLTSVTLAQIILENERSHRAALPSGFLHQLIKHGEAWQEFVQRSMRSSLEGIVSSQRDLERVFRDWAGRAGWGVPATEGPPRDGAEPDAEALRAEVSQLRERLRSLEDRIERRTRESK